jgi:hypothetical protein
MAAATNETDRVCPECQKSFKDKGNTVTCGDSCAKTRMLRQQREWHTKRKVDKPKPSDRACRECVTVFTPYSGRQVLCSRPECKKQALLNAITRQTQRRQARKTEAHREV